MLSYQHIYHAGNAADVHKHLWLLAVLGYLKHKEKPFFWLDTHAGRGLYDLQSPEAQKLAEFKDGYARLAENTKTPTDLLKTYHSAVNRHNPGKNSLNHYPGSALLAADMLRPQDVLHACELHKQESVHLENTLKPYKNCHMRKESGYHALKALLPPSPRRGGVLIDPSYEIKTEYAEVLEAVRSACKKWPQGIYMVWYPLLPAGAHKPMTEGFEAMKSGGTDITIDEWIFHDPDRQTGRGLYGSGMVIVNAPYTTADQVLAAKNSACFF